jgi:hypothetical protein
MFFTTKAARFQNRDLPHFSAVGGSMRLHVGGAVAFVSTKTGADMGHDPKVTRLYSLRKPAQNVAAFGRGGEGRTGEPALIFIDIPKEAY